MHRFRSRCTAAALFTVSGAVAAPIDISLWRHESGDIEVVLTKEQIENFNRSQNKYRVVYENIPKGSHTQSVTAAAVAKKLPCLLDLDAPTVPNLAWAGYLRPLDGLLDPNVLSTLMAGGKGEYKGVLYSVGPYDASLGIFARKSALAAVGARIPTIDKPWTLAEFDDTLAKLKKLPGYEYVIDLRNNADSEWWTYAYSPWLQSFGGDLIDRKTMTHASDVLNGKPAVAFGRWFQGLFRKGYANKRPIDDKSFLLGRVPLDYSGNWNYADAKAKWKDDLLVLPPPDFGHGPKTGAASWQYGISATCPALDGAVAFINYIMQPQRVAKNVDRMKVPPTTQAAADLTTDYRPGGSLRFYFEFMQRYAVTRPATPAYPIITSTFEKAMRKIIEGADAQSTLDDATDSIERNIRDNKGYGFKL
ncbi:MAG: extracellular solute-binding protein [Herbaspirillum sp.]